MVVIFLCSTKPTKRGQKQFGPHTKSGAFAAKLGESPPLDNTIFGHFPPQPVTVLAQSSPESRLARQRTAKTRRAFPLLPVVEGEFCWKPAICMEQVLLS